MHRREVRGDECLERLFREARMLVDFGGVGRDLLLAQVAQDGAQFVVFVGKLEQIEIGIT